MYYNKDREREITTERYVLQQREKLQQREVCSGRDTGRAGGAEGGADWGGQAPPVCNESVQWGHWGWSEQLHMHCMHDRLALCICTCFSCN